MSSPLIPIYLDYHATTPVDPRVVEAMLPWYTEHFGNPASRSHAYGWKASEAVELARAQIADCLVTDPKDIIFTSGATEGLNMAIKGLAESLTFKGKHVITVSTEHHAVLDSVQWLESKGFDITRLTVLADGLLDLERLGDAIRKDTIMVVVMWANNETGVIQDMRRIGEVCKKSGVILISDATQAFGKLALNPVDTGVEILAFSAHKFYGPKGIGALYLNQKSLKVKPLPLIHGGGHEGGFRSGTLNVPGIVGMGHAAMLRQNMLKDDASRLKQLRDQFEKAVLSSVEEVAVNGNIVNRLHTVSNLKVRFVESQAVMTRFRSRLAISSGSACSSANPEPSHVLLAMGLSPAEAKGSFRISLGMPTTGVEIELAAKIFIEAIEAERAQSPVWQMFKQGVDLSSLV